ncbi:ABC-2 type transport system ATP-binding protein [Brevibacterium sanguinis]|uniref:ABC-2 type transport system ATP-binding protein n=2 Tax=Brevibacterium TaxID=1696 RepID=A0A366IK40_9MICO|nr:MULTISPECIES: ABC transporter ATP-binding protein [Brevibacterium]RBP64209.1 ABC-2 type transport system ATP-binding protein [Brevibacterium sanguinis]RBP71499.1 ABC-2 type transport system ATP-binding protein [Brevibacterium celere]
MTSAASTSALTKSYGPTRACDAVTVDIRDHTITGLLGRNGAGKTTLMQLLTGQLMATSGTATVFGQPVFENPDALSRICFIQENQRYPDALTATDLLRVAARIYPNWDETLARTLVSDFRLPLRTGVDKKLSRGQRSALGIVIGLASRAELSLFDEPYLGLDAVARQLFYDHLLAEFADHPRAMVVSTHLIDEAADLLEDVIVLDRGRVLVTGTAEELGAAALEVTGPADEVERRTAGLRLLSDRRLGALRQVRVIPGPDTRLGDLDVAPVSLQDFIVALSTAPEHGCDHTPESATVLTDQGMS